MSFVSFNTFRCIHFCCLPYPASGWRSRPSARLLFDRCAMAPETQLLPAVSRAHALRDVDRLFGVLRPGGSGDSPAPSSAVPMAAALSPSRSPVPSPRPFWARNCWLCWLSAGGYGVPSPAGNGAGSGRWSPLPLRAPAGNPTPITQVKVRTRAKSITGFRF